MMHCRFCEVIQCFVIAFINNLKQKSFLCTMRILRYIRHETYSSYYLSVKVNGYPTLDTMHQIFDLATFSNKS